MSKHQSSQRVRLRLVVVELDAEFTEDDPPSLPAIPVEGEDITDRPGVVKAAAEWPRKRAVAK